MISGRVEALALSSHSPRSFCDSTRTRCRFGSLARTRGSSPGSVSLSLSHTTSHQELRLSFLPPLYDIGIARSRNFSSLSYSRGTRVNWLMNNISFDFKSWSKDVERPRGCAKKRHMQVADAREDHVGSYACNCTVARLTEGVASNKIAG